MADKTPEEIYDYVFNYKSDLQERYNNDQEKLFDDSNKLKIQLSGQMIVFSSLLLSIGAGYLLSNPDIELTIKNLLIFALFAFTSSVTAGLFSIYSASEFMLKWAKHAHEKGGMVNRDKSHTAEELEKLLKKIGKKSAAMPERNSLLPTILQILLFSCGIVLVLIALCIVAYT